MARRQSLEAPSWTRMRSITKRRSIYTRNMHGDAASAKLTAARTSVLSVHSHAERSYLDDRELMVAAGALRSAGFHADLLVAVLDPGELDCGRDGPFARLCRALENYDVVVFERIWSRELADALRRGLPGKIFVHLRGEHELADPPADWICAGDYGTSLVELLEHLHGRRANPPTGSQKRGPNGFSAPARPSLRQAKRFAFAPVLNPVFITPERLDEIRSFAVRGNDGCPYQADARDNPLYEGVQIPAEFGRGCAFCTTGNRYEPRSSEQTRHHVLEQIRYVRRNSNIANLVLKDQNPFSYLTELMEDLEREQVPSTTLLLETRADWFLRNARRFERALEAAERGGHAISPYLVGIENFSQPELDRYNKGIAAETNERFIEALWGWKAKFGNALRFEHCAFGFVLFSPWTTLADLRINYDAIVRTRFHELRGRVLLSRARLYPDTALYWLAKRDGLLLSEADASFDNSKRYGYFPAAGFRHEHPEVEHFARLATEMLEARNGADELGVFGALLKAFENSAEPLKIDRAAIEGAIRGDRGLRERFERLLTPLDLSNGFAEGWRLSELRLSEGEVRARFHHPGEAPLDIFLTLRGSKRGYSRSRHYDLRCSALHPSPKQARALFAVASALRGNDV